MTTKMKCRQRPVEFDCWQVEDPDENVNGIPVPIGNYMISLPNGDLLTCTYRDFHSIYEVVDGAPTRRRTEDMGFYTPNKLHVVYVFHNTSSHISYVNDAGVVVTLPIEEFGTNFHPTPEPVDRDHYVEHGRLALEQGTKEIHAPEIAGDAEAPEHDLSLPSTGNVPFDPEAEVTTAVPGGTNDPEDATVGGDPEEVNPENAP